jgi:hypothetical protein
MLAAKMKREEVFDAAPTCLVNDGRHNLVNLQNADVVEKQNIVPSHARVKPGPRDIAGGVWKDILSSQDHPL